MVRAVHEFDFRLVVNETPNKWRPVEGRPYSDRDLMFLTGSVCCSPTGVATVKGLYPRCERQLRSLE
jgi:hypothetical protein